MEAALNSATKGANLAKLITLNQQSEDSVAFDKVYFGSHLPLISKVPGLEQTDITGFIQTLHARGIT